MELTYRKSGPIFFLAVLLFGIHLLGGCDTGHREKRMGISSDQPESTFLNYVNQTNAEVPVAGKDVGTMNKTYLPSDQEKLNENRINPNGHPPIPEEDIKTPTNSTGQNPGDPLYL